MFSVKLPRGKIKGATVFNKWVDDLVTSVEALWNFNVSGIVTMSRNAKTGISIHVPPFPIFVFLTTSAIGARVGATPGSGTATFQMFNGTSFVSDANYINQKLYNFSSNASGIATGKYGIGVAVFGYDFAVAVEC